MAYDADRALDHSVIYVSADRGRTWTIGHETGESVDPFCAFGRDGTLVFLHLARETGQMELFRSVDGGHAWSRPDVAPYLDRPYLTMDPRGRLFINAHEAPASDPRTRVATLLTSDNGKRFAAAQPDVNRPTGVTPGNGVLLRDGTFVSVFASVRPAASRVGSALGLIGITASRDAGQHLDAAVPIAEWYGELGSMSLSVMPQLAIDQTQGPWTGRLYAVWPDTRSGRAEIYVSWSGDAGRTWSPVVKVSDDVPSDQRRDHLQPAITVNNRGIVGVSWYDRRDTTDNLGWRARFAASFDGGRSFESSVAVADHSYDPQKTTRQTVNEVLDKVPRNGGTPTRRPRWNFAFSGGDTAGISADGTGAFHVFWLDNRTGVQQVWTSTIIAR